MIAGLFHPRRVAVAALLGGDVGLVADDRIDLVRLALVVELERPVEIAVVGDRHSVHAGPLHLLDEVGNPVGPVEQAVVRVAMKMDERAGVAHGHPFRIDQSEVRSPTSEVSIPRGSATSMLDRCLILSFSVGFLQQAPGSRRICGGRVPARSTQARMLRAFGKQLSVAEQPVFVFQLGRRDADDPRSQREHVVETGRRAVLDVHFHDDEEVSAFFHLAVVAPLARNNSVRPISK